MTREQKGVMAGMASALAVVFAVFAYAHWIGSATLSIGVALGILMLPLALEIALLAKKRFFAADAITGAAYDAVGSDAAISRAILQNTLEQTVLAAGVYIAFGAALPVVALSLLAPALGLFLAGRILFFFNYRKGATARAFGFGLTFYSTLVLFVVFLIALLP